MKTILVILAMLVSTALMMSSATAAPSFQLATELSVASTIQDAGPFDSYLGQGDLLTRAVPVCCCVDEGEICIEAPPGSICHGTSSECRCNAFHACRLP